MKNARILVIGEAVTSSHILRPMVIANELVLDNLSVYFACDKNHKPDLLSSKIKFFHLQSISPTTFQNRLLKGQPAYSKQELKSYLEEELHLIDRIKPDIIISDFRITLSVSAKIRNVYHIAISNAQWSPDNKIKLIAPDLLITKLLGEKLSNFVLNQFKSKIFSKHIKCLNELRAQNNLPELKDINEIYTKSDHTFYLDLPELFTEGIDKRNYIGPFNCIEEIALPNWWDELPLNKPNIFISAGSSGDSDYMVKVAKKLSALDVNIIFATAGKVPLNFFSEKNIFTAIFLPGRPVAKKCDLMICNGGSGMVYLALQAAKPILCIPQLMDQYLVSEAVKKNGFGAVLRPRQANLRHIKPIVLKLLQDSQIKWNLNKVKHSFSSFRPLDKIKDHVYSRLARMENKRKLSRLTQRLNRMDKNKQLPASQFEGVEISLATKMTEYQQAFELIFNQYAKMGYVKPNVIKMRHCIWNLLPTNQLIVAKLGDKVVGTISVIKDSEVGLPMNCIVKDFLDSLRNGNRILGELSSLAVNEELTCKSTVLAMFRFAQSLSVNQLGITDFVISINPRHKAFYEKILCFDNIGALCSYALAENAPACPMRLNLLTSEKIYKTKYSKTNGARNLYEYFYGNMSLVLSKSIKKEYNDYCKLEISKARFNILKIIGENHYSKKEIKFLIDHWEVWLHRIKEASLAS